MVFLDFHLLSPFFTECIDPHLVGMKLCMLHHNSAVHGGGGAPGPDPFRRLPTPPAPPPCRVLAGKCRTMGANRPQTPPQTPPPPPPPEIGWKVGGSRRMARCYAPPPPCCSLWGRTVRAVHALCARCAKSWPFSTTGSSVSSEDWKDVIEWLLQWTGL